MAASEVASAEINPILLGGIAILWSPGITGKLRPGSSISSIGCTRPCTDTVQYLVLAVTNM